MMRNVKSTWLGAVLLVSLGVGFQVSPKAAAATQEVEASPLRGKVMCGYQGWFRCPGDAANMGWIHWNRTASAGQEELLRSTPAPRKIKAKLIVRTK
jgi:hypothetical protein